VVVTHKPWSWWFNTRGRRALLISGPILALAGCGGSKIATVKGNGARGGKTIAVSPPQSPDSLINSGSELADAIGTELAARGFVVLDIAATAARLRKYDIPSGYALTKQGLSTLRKENVDSVLTVSSTATVAGGPSMRHVQARLTSTATAEEIGGVNWDNSWGGMPGSPADFTMRKDVATAAKEIASELVKLLGEAPTAPLP